MKGAFIMAVKFNLRLCLQLIDRGISLNIEAYPSIRYPNNIILVNIPHPKQNIE